MLEYDNSAFYYFSITLLTIYLLPGYYYLLKELWLAFVRGASKSDGTAARTALEKDKASKIRGRVQGLARLRHWTFLANLTTLVLATALFVYLINLVISDGEVSTFDPYQILGIEMGSSVAEIKRQYRKLSLKFHPDKNVGSKVAEEMFMKIAKAYEALTDETSKENYEKYGNPDGKQSLEVSIGLPSVILDNPKVVLVLYLVAMVVVIPVAVGVWYSNSKQFGEKNILYESYTAFYQLLTEQHRVKLMPEVMAASAESRRINAPRAEDAEQLLALKNKMKSEKLMQKPKFEHPQILKGNLLLHCHVLRMTADLSPAFRKDLDELLARAPELIDGMIEIAHQRRWLQTTLATIRFQQCVVQALWGNDSPLLQLPHFTDEMARAVVRGAKGGAGRALWEFIRAAPTDRKGLSELSPAHVEDVTRACDLFPHLEASYDLYVEEEEGDFFDDEDVTPAAGAEAVQGAVRGEEIYENDLVTLRVKLLRQNVAEGEHAPPVHAPLFPATIREGWWLILTDKPRVDSSVSAGEAEATIHAIERIADQSRSVKHEVRFMAPPQAGTYRMLLHVLSDCYAGLDEEIEIEFTVKPAGELPVYKPHQEDLELDNEPTLFEQVMTADVDDSSDEEDEEEEGERPVGGAELKRSAVKQMASPVSLDEDSEEED